MGYNSNSLVEGKVPPILHLKKMSFSLQGKRGWNFVKVKEMYPIFIINESSVYYIRKGGFPPKGGRGHFNIGWHFS